MSDTFGFPAEPSQFVRSSRLVPKMSNDNSSLAADFLRQNSGDSSRTGITMSPNSHQTAILQNLNSLPSGPISSDAPNPPCNTLYIGGLPADTSEDELKDLFSKQQGYKRLCFRTKQSRPLCFVEFEDVACATLALHELHDYPLDNSGKYKLRLSFSIRPLGIRTGQATSSPNWLALSSDNMNSIHPSPAKYPGSHSRDCKA